LLIVDLPTRSMLLSAQPGGSLSRYRPMLAS
jgi:hypothetical protein